MKSTQSPELSLSETSAPDTPLVLRREPSRESQSQDPISRGIEALIARGVTSENVDAFDKLLSLYERLQNKDAEKQFNVAFASLQGDLLVIVAKTIIPNRGKYEKFEDVMEVVSPLAKKYGFSISFSMENRDNRVFQTCKVKHVSGFSQENSFAVRTGKADTETQADCKAATTAKRNALLNAFNIVIRQDIMQNEEGDASLEGALISPDKVIYLREKLAETGSNESAFLRMAGVDRIEDIRTGGYGVLIRALEMKQKR